MAATLFPVRILVVEDEVVLARSLARGLTAEGFDVDVVHDGTDGLWHAREHTYGAIVLDLLLPGMNGYQICGTLRAEQNWTPVLMLTSKDGEYDEAEALDTGADDFLSKPFSFVVLVARLRALTRRGSTPRPPVLSAGDLVYDPLSRGCHRGDVAVPLTAREIGLLETLMRRQGEVVPKRELLARGVGRRHRRRHQRRGGVRGLPAPQDRRALRPAQPADRARPRLPARGGCRSPGRRREK